MTIALPKTFDLSWKLCYDLNIMKQKTQEHKDKISASLKEHFKHNPHPRGMLGKKHSKESNLKRSLALKGREKSAETRAKMGAWQVGRKFSDEIKRKISDAQKRHHARNPGMMSGEKNPMFGIHLTGNRSPGWKGGKRHYWGRIAHEVWKDYWRELVPKGCVIHHIDGDKTNNSINNLACVSPAKHASLHHRMKKVNKCQ